MYGHVEAGVMKKEQFVCVRFINDPLCLRVCVGRWIVIGLLADDGGARREAKEEECVCACGYVYVKEEWW